LIRSTDLTAAFVGALEEGDLAAGTAMFARQACFLTRDATAIHGREQIGAILAQMIDRRPRFHVEPRSLLDLGDLVLARERWTMRFQPGGAGAFEESTDATLLLRQVESKWKLALLAPWGWR
jgi:ketosteroid isomerase-like protein